MLRNGHAIIALYIALQGFTSGCGQLKRHAEQPASPRDDRVALLRTAAEAWRTEVNTAADTGGGWPAGRDCDGTLWSSLARAAGADHIDLGLIEHAPGRIDRRPKPSCLEDEDGNGNPDSGSSTSRDQLTGYMKARWRARDVGALERLAAYGEANGWVMGDGDAARTGLRTNLQGLLGRMLRELGGRAPRCGSFECRFLPPLYVAAGKDYERHIAVQGIELQGEVGLSGLPHTVTEIDINGDMLGVLNALAREAPADAKFQAVRGIYDGDMAPAMDLLLDDAYQCPSYVRPLPVYCIIHRLDAADTVLRRFL